MHVEFDVPEAILHELLDDIELPRMARIRARINSPSAIPDVESAVSGELALSRVRGDFKPGDRVAVAVGSRGIGRLPEIVYSLIASLLSWGARPFIVPAMGSHGGATASGQVEVLAHLGIREADMGVPIVSSMQTVVVGHSVDGVPVHIDKHAAEADAVVFIARVKPHTAFRGPYESGMAKMVAIGLGKQAGASLTHARGFGEMARMVPAMASVALGAVPIRFGIAVLENAHDEPYRVVVVPGDRILTDEPHLLEEAKAAMPRIPFDSIDVLVIDQIGKNISGDGADPNITGRYPTPYAYGGPRIEKQVVLDLSDESAGNANGIGTADFTTVRLARKMDWGQTYPNALTSTVPGPVALPMVLPSDRLAIAAGLRTCNAVNRPPTLLRIYDTLHVGEFWVSASLLEANQGREDLEVVQPPAPIDFDGEGDLRDLAGQLVPARPHVSRDDAW